MTNLLKFPSKKPLKTLGEEDLKSHPDASLLLSCFERVQHALETIERGEKIEAGQLAHGILTETCAALSVLFKRKTGGDVKEVSGEHQEIIHRYLLAGDEPPDMHIPIESADFRPVHPHDFAGRTNLELVLSSLNYTTKVQETLLEVFPTALDMDIARVFSIDATTALHVLKDRLSDHRPSNHQLVGRVAHLSIEWYRAQAIAKTRRAQLNDEYRRYFQVNGEPEPNHRRINPDDPAYEGVINFTNAAYERLVDAQRQKNNAKRRLETAVRALMAFSGDTVQVPKKPYVARANIHGETLQ